MDNFKTIKFTDGDFSLDVRVSVEDGTIWLSANERKNQKMILSCIYLTKQDQSHCMETVLLLKLKKN